MRSGNDGGATFTEHLWENFSFTISNPHKCPYRVGIVVLEIWAPKLGVAVSAL